VSGTDAALVMCEKLTAAGIRATTDMGAMNPPAVLVLLPDRVYDLACGWTARWTLYAIGSSPFGADRTTMHQLDEMVDAVASVYPVELVVKGVFGARTLATMSIQFSEVCE
jgi:hypothetical protein